MTNLKKNKKGVSGEKLNLVTGACGFTGSHLVKHLIDNGEKVIATDLEKSYQDPRNKMIRENIGLDLSHPSVEFIPSDLTDRESLKSIFNERKITHIFHTASLYDYSAPIELLKKVNIDGMINICDIAVEMKIKRFIHWSTCGVFGRPYTASDKKKTNIPFTEESPSPANMPEDASQPAYTYLVNDYSITKWKQEQIVWKYFREKRLPVTVLRPAPIYGPGSNYGHGGIILAIYKGYLPFIPSDSKSFITVSVHVHDVVRFAYFISDKDLAIGEDYNIVDDSIISYHEFLHYIALLLGRRMWDIPFIYLPSVKPFAVHAARFWLWLEKNLKVPRIRVFEVGSAVYIGSSYWISNNKSKRSGFIYKYPDVRLGLRDTIEWFIKVGWIK